MGSGRRPRHRRANSGSRRARWSPARIRGGASTWSWTSNGGSMKTRAAVFWGPERPFTVEEIDIAPPGPGDVVVRMAAAGICGTDLHCVKGEWSRPTPMVLGHEGVGIVEAVGSEVEDLASGDKVVLSWAASCGECADCRRRRPAACARLQIAIGTGTL